MGLVKTGCAEVKNRKGMAFYIVDSRAAPHDPHTRHLLAFMKNVQRRLSLMLILILQLRAGWHDCQPQGCTLRHFKGSILGFPAPPKVTHHLAAGTLQDSCLCLVDAE